MNLARICQPLVFAPCLTACALLPGGNGESGAVIAEPPTSWRCGDLLVETRREGDALLLDLPGEQRRLEPVAAASGARFTDRVDTGFWNKGDEAMLRAYGEVYSNCTASDQRSPWAEAADRGLRLRGLGQEPGWLVEIGAGDEPSMRLLLDYGARELAYDRIDMAEEDGTPSFASRDGRVSVRTASEPCRDSMSGHRFLLSLTVRVDDTHYHGCGRDYAAAASAPDW